MFMGEYLHTLDDKGRLTIPVKFREELGERFIATKGLDNCLFAFPMSEWKTFEQKLRTLPLSQPQAREFVRFFSAGAAECEIDKQGRILIPLPLKQHARLEKEVVVAGVMDRVEIWAQPAWEAYTARAEENYGQAAASLVDFGV